VVQNDPVPGPKVVQALGIPAARTTSARATRCPILPTGEDRSFLYAKLWSKHKRAPTHQHSPPMQPAFPVLAGILVDALQHGFQARGLSGGIRPIARRQENPSRRG
jgi:hypothetical protein